MLAFCIELTIETSTPGFQISQVLVYFLKAVEKLISRGCDVNQRSKDGMTPLSIAAFWGYAEITEILLENG